MGVEIAQDEHGNEGIQSICQEIWQGVAAALLGYLMININQPQCLFTGNDIEDHRRGRC